MEDKVFIVASFGYDGAYIKCAAPSLEEAQKIAEKINNSQDDYLYKCQGIELPIFDSSVEMISMFSMNCDITDDGRIQDERFYDWKQWPFHEPEEISCRWVRAPCHRDEAGRLELKGTDKSEVFETFFRLRQGLLEDLDLRMNAEMIGGSDWETVKEGKDA